MDHNNQFFKLTFADADEILDEIADAVAKNAAESLRDKVAAIAMNMDMSDLINEDGTPVNSIDYADGIEVRKNEDSGLPVGAYDVVSTHSSTIPVELGNSSQAPRSPMFRGLADFQSDPNSLKKGGV